MYNIRHFGTGLLLTAIVLPAAAGPGIYAQPPCIARSAKTGKVSQAPQFIKIEVISQPGGLGRKGRVADDAGGPDAVQIRLPIALAKRVLVKILEKEMHKEIALGGMEKSDFDIADLMDILEGSRSGDVLLEVKTGDGDLVKITLE